MRITGAEDKTEIPICKICYSAYLGRHNQLKHFFFSTQCNDARVPAFQFHSFIGDNSVYRRFGMVTIETKRGKTENLSLSELLMVFSFQFYAMLRSIVSDLANMSERWCVYPRRPDWPDSSCVSAVVLSKICIINVLAWVLRFLHSQTFYIMIQIDNQATV